MKLDPAAGLAASFAGIVGSCEPGCGIDMGLFSVLAEVTGVPERGDGSSFIVRRGKIGVRAMWL
jgi:hypothetical protein